MPGAEMLRKVDICHHCEYYYTCIHLYDGACRHMAVVVEEMKKERGRNEIRSENYSQE